MKPQLPPVAEVVAALLLEVGAVEVASGKPFTLTSGKLSPVYFDCRRVISHPGAMNMIAGMFQWMMDGLDSPVDVIAGGVSAGVPFADRLATVTGKPLVYVRKAAREHGTGSAVEGGIDVGARVLLVEDQITDGGSKLAFVRGLRDAQAAVDHCFVILDREQGGEANLAQHKVTLHSLVTATAVLDYGQRSGFLGDDAAASIQQYLDDPEKWETSHRG